MAGRVEAGSSRTGRAMAVVTLALALVSGASAGCAGAPEGAEPDGESESAVSEGAREEEPAALRILALGDSYTIGEGVAERGRWPQQLRDALRARGWNCAEPRVIARTGWTTIDLERAIEGSELSPPYDLVTLLIGVNDQFQGMEAAGYAKRFEALLERAVELAGGAPERTLVISIPDYSVTPFGERFGAERIRTALEQFNQINRRAAQSLGVARVDITGISQRASREPELLANDRLHPSARMYQEWVQLALPVVERALRAGTDGP